MTEGGPINEVLESILACDHEGDMPISPLYLKPLICHIYLVISKIKLYPTTARTLSKLLIMTSSDY